MIGSASHPWLSPRRLMTVSVVVALLTIALKTGAWWVTGSVGLLSDAMESLVNLAAALFGLCHRRLATLSRWVGESPWIH